MTRRRRWSLVLLAAVLVAPTLGRGDEIVRGTVVSLEAGEIYFDIGAASGLAPGAPLRILRAVQLRHPVTGALVSDELLVGETLVTTVGSSLSRAVPEATLAAAVKVGDAVEAYVVKEPTVRRRPPPAPASAPVVEAPMPSLDPATEKVLALWSATSGKPVAARIAAFEGYLADTPGSPFAKVIGEDLERLRSFRQEVGALDAERQAETPTVAALEQDRPRRATHHLPLDLAFASRDIDGIRSAWVHYRHRGSETFRRVPLHRDGDAYLRGEIPGDEVAAPGLEYFVEVATLGGVVGAAVGSPDQPVAVAIAAPRDSDIFVSRRNRSQVSTRFTYLDFATFDGRKTGDTTDRVYLFEADFLYRLHTVLYGLRVGFGVLDGRGGTREPMADPEHSGFNYGYVELELRLLANLAVRGRGGVGVGKDGLGGGVEGRVRLGPEEGTNLTFALSSLQNIGFLSELHLQWAVFPRAPIGLAVAVTDQPAQGDLGVRFSADVGVRVGSWFTPTLRVSYQGRTVQHSGVGVGLGMVFDW